MKLQTFISQKLYPILKKQNTFMTISTAESCTGGLIAKTLTDISGSSNYFFGGIVAYANNVKIKELFVSKNTLKKFGAISKQTAIEMGKGCIKKFRTDFAISTTGIAGPTGGSDLKSVGLVYICIIDKNKKKIVYKYNFRGDRDKIRKKATRFAIFNLFRFIKKSK
jgi:PncC family amidohydrolase